MFEPFLRAAKNDTVFIKNWLPHNPGKINEPWDGYYLPEELPNRASQKQIWGYTSLGIALSFALIAPVGALAYVALISTSAFTLNEGRKEIQLHNMASFAKTHQGWTLLEFAAEAGASHVAAILILEGAVRTPRFKRLMDAKKSTQPEFVDLCNVAIRKMQSLEMLDNKRLEAMILEDSQEGIDDLEEELAAAQTPLPAANAANVNTPARLVELEDKLSVLQDKYKRKQEKLYETRQVCDFWRESARANQPAQSAETENQLNYDLYEDATASPRASH